MDFEHTSVMLNEAVDALAVKSNGTYLDCTLGGGGHAKAIGERLNADGKLIGLDRDDDAIQAATATLAKLTCHVTTVHANFSELDKILDDLHVDELDGAIFDLGVSSHQIDTVERGFSYMKDSPLDMRMDRRQPLTARDVINRCDENHLAKIFRDYGEERFARRAANAICRPTGCSSYRSGSASFSPVSAFVASIGTGTISKAAISSHQRLFSSIGR